MKRNNSDRNVRSPSSQRSVDSRDQSDSRRFSQAEQERNHLYNTTDQLIRNMIKEKSDIHNPFVLINDIVLKKDKEIKMLSDTIKVLQDQLRNAYPETLYPKDNQGQKLISDSDSSNYNQPCKAQTAQLYDIQKRKRANKEKYQQYQTATSTFLASIVNFISRQVSQNQTTVKIPKQQYESLLHNTKNKLHNQYSLFKAQLGYEPIHQEQECLISKKQLQQIKDLSFQRKFQEIFKKCQMTEQWEKFMKLENLKQVTIVREVQKIRSLQAKIAQAQKEEGCKHQDSFITTTQQEIKIWKKMQFRLKQFRIFMSALKITSQELKDFEKVIKEKQVAVIAKLIQVQAKKSVAESMYEAIDKKRQEVSQPLLKFINDYCNYFFKKLADIFLQKKVPVEKHLRKSLMSEQLKSDIKAMDLEAASQSIRKAVDKMFNNLNKHSIFWSYDKMRIRFGQER